MQPLPKKEKEMTLINCMKCHEAIEIPDELIGDASPDEIEYVCEACEPDDDIGDDDDGEPDFSLDDLEWDETYPELCAEECSSGFVGTQLPCGFIAHVSPDVQPETLVALDEMGKAVLKAWEEGKL